MEDQWLQVAQEHRLKKEKTEMVKQHEYDEVDNGGKIECIEYLEDFLSREEYIGYLRGNIAKYMHRWRRKNGLEDLKKAEWYGARLIALVEQGGA